MHSTNGAKTTHPPYCDHARCNRNGPNLHHRSTPALFIPQQRGTTEARAVQVSIERLDEIDDATGVQTQHPAEVVLSYTVSDEDREAERQVRWGIEDFRDVACAVLEMYDHAERVAAAS